MRSATLRRHGALQRVAPDDTLVSAAVGPDGRALALWAPAAGRQALLGVDVSPAGSSFPRAQSSEPVAARVTVQTGTIEATVQVPELDIAFPIVQPLPQDRLLLVGTRCRWRPDEPDENGLVLDDTGTAVVSATIGDGIGHVRTTPAGSVWVGYFDEGVYGNYGWGRPGPKPVGAPGIVRFTPDLQVAWRYPYGVPYGPVDDCYALAGDGEAVWACYYSGFPIVHLASGEVRGWRNDVGGARALLADGASAALLGGYRPDHDRFVVGALQGDSFEVFARGRLVLDDGSPLPVSALLYGTGTQLDVFIGEAWYRTDLDALMGVDRRR